MSVVNRFAKAWDHTLNIKHIFMDTDAGDLPSAEETADMARQIVSAIRSLQSKISDKDELWHELDNCCDEFDAFDGIENAYEARDVFNAALHGLYDVGDRAKRVWIG